MEKKLVRFIKNNKIKFYYSRQSAYIHHGYVANFLLKKKSQGISNWFKK